MIKFITDENQKKKEVLCTLDVSLDTLYFRMNGICVFHISDRDGSVILHDLDIEKVLYLKSFGIGIEHTLLKLENTTFDPIKHEHKMQSSHIRVDSCLLT